MPIAGSFRVEIAKGRLNIHTAYGMGIRQNDHTIGQIAHTNPTAGSC